MIYMGRLLAYVLTDDNEEKISLINMENTKWCCGHPRLAQWAGLILGLSIYLFHGFWVSYYR